MEYFGTLPPDELIKELMGKIESYYNWLLQSERLGRMRMAYDTYYGTRNQSSSHYLTASGQQGELTLLMDNEYRNLVQHLVNLTTQSRQNVEAAAANSDRASMDSAILAKQLCDYYRRELKLNKYQKLALELSLVNDLSWVFTEWDITKGEPLRPDVFNGGQLITKGDPKVSVKGPLDCVIDITRDMGGDDDWQIKRELVNKFDYAALYPEKKDEIIGLSRDRHKDSVYRFGENYYYSLGFDSDYVDLYTLYHRKTPAVQSGRMVTFFNSKLWLYDGPLPYDGLPGIRCCPTEKIASALGYSNANDLLALQDVMDAMISSAVTNMTTCGVNNVWSKPGSNFDFTKLAEGMNLFESEEEPKVLMLNRLPPEWFNLANFIIQRMEALSGVNSVARGNTEGKDFSGAAMALLQSMAIQFNSGLQEAYAQVTEDIYNNLISMLQKFAGTERMATIIGVNNKYMLQGFSSEDLQGVKRVYVQVSNPLESTTSGKMEIAKELMQIPGAISTPEKYLEVIRTGQLESFVEDDEKDLLLVKSENEALAKGEPVLALLTDKHPKHILCHRAVISDPINRLDVDLVQRVTMHIQEHVNILRTADPALLAILGMQSIAPMMPVPQLPQEEGVQPPPNPGEPDIGGPRMPTNPLTGEEYVPVGGGRV